MADEPIEAGRNLTVDLWRQAQRIFGLCVDLPELERRKLLDEHCTGNPELRIEVERLLRGDQQADSLAEVIGAAAGQFLRASDEAWIGRRIGSFIIERKIAQGGMGVVYLARRSGPHFKQKVAIKLLTTDLHSEHRKSRFLVERQILASLAHENIARLLDGGESEDGAQFLVMEYIDGIPIDQYCDQNRLSVEQRIGLFTQVCEAVQFAHSNLVIHRDIKPGNVLVTERGIPKLLDFGIAKLLGDHILPVQDTFETQVGMHVLSPRYASPEQVLGQAVSVASDVYGLGLLLHELLCGGFPYVLDDPRPSAIEHTITSTPPQGPSQVLKGSSNARQLSAARACRSADLVRTLKGDLDTIVLKALRKEPARRYASALEIVHDLERHQQGLPILARPPKLMYLASKYWKRNRAAAGGIIAAALAFLLGASAATVGFVEARRSSLAAQIQARNAEVITRFLISLFEESDPNQSSNVDRTVRQLLEIGAERVDRELQETPLAHALALESLSGVYKSLADYPRARSMQSRALGLLRQSAPADLAGQSRMLAHLGDLQRLLSEYDAARRSFEESLRLYDAAGLPPTAELADTMNGLSLVLEETAQYQAARQMMNDTLQLRRAVLEAPHADIAQSFHNLAWLSSRRNRFDEAEQFARQALEMRTAIWGEIHPRVASSFSMLSRICRSQGRWEEAESMASRAVSIAKQIFEDGHPDLSFPLYELAMVQYDRGRLREASESLRQVSEWERFRLGPESHDYGMSSKAYAMTLLDLGRYAEAEAILHEAGQIFDQLPPTSSGARYHTATLLGRVLARTGRLAAAQEVLEGHSNMSGDPSLSQGLMFDRRLAMAELHLLRGELASGWAQVDSMYVTLRDLPIGSRPLWANLQDVRARFLLASGQNEQSLEVFSAALSAFAMQWDESYWPAALTRARMSEALLRTGRPEQALQELETAVTALLNTLGASHPETVHWTSRLARVRSLQD